MYKLCTEIQLEHLEVSSFDFFAPDIVLFPYEAGFLSLLHVITRTVRMGRDPMLKETTKDKEMKELFNQMPPEWKHVQNLCTGSCARWEALMSWSCTWNWKTEEYYTWSTPVLPTDELIINTWSIPSNGNLIGLCSRFALQAYARHHYIIMCFSEFSPSKKLNIIFIFVI